VVPGRPCFAGAVPQSTPALAIDDAANRRAERLAHGARGQEARSTQDHPARVHRGTAHEQAGDGRLAAGAQIVGAQEAHLQRGIGAVLDRAALHRGELGLDVQRRGEAPERLVVQLRELLEERHAAVRIGLALGLPVRGVAHDGLGPKQLVPGRRHGAVEAAQVGDVEPLGCGLFSAVHAFEVGVQLVLGLEPAEDDHRLVYARVFSLETRSPAHAEVKAEHGALLPLPAFDRLSQLVGQGVVVDELQEGLLGVQSRDDRSALDALTVIGLDGHRVAVLQDDALHLGLVDHATPVTEEGAVDRRRESVGAALDQARSQHAAEVERKEEAQGIVEMQPPHGREAEQRHPHARILEAILVDQLDEGALGDVGQVLPDVRLAERHHLVQRGLGRLVGHGDQVLIQHGLEVAPHGAEALGVLGAEALDGANRLLVIAREDERRAVAEGKGGDHVWVDVTNAQVRQTEVLSGRHDVAHHVVDGVEVESPAEVLIGIEAAAGLVAALDERHLVARASQVGGAEQPVGAATDHDRVMDFAAHRPASSSPAFIQRGSTPMFNGISPMCERNHSKGFARHQSTSRQPRSSATSQAARYPVARWVAPKGWIEFER